MTPDILEYLLRVTAIWAVLLAYYSVSGRWEGFRFQRILLLGGWLFGLLVPLLPALAVGTNLPVVSLPTASYVAPVFVVQAGEAAVENGWNLLDVLPWVYLLGVIVFGARTLVQWRYVQQCLRVGKRSTYAGYPVVRSEKIRSPFAAGGYVFLPEQMPDAALENTALLHETSHLRARHHYDKLLLTLGGIVLWFHPLTWVYRRLLATVHEYEADAAVLQSVPARTYGLQLLHCSLGPTGSLGLFSSPLKKRINMITDKTPKRTLRFLPLLTLCLLLLGLVVACSDVAEATLTSEIIAEELSPNENGVMHSTYAGDVHPLMVTDETLLSDQTLEALIRSIYEDIRYPAEARAAGIHGTVSWVAHVETDGEISFLAGSASGLTEAIVEIVIVGNGKPKPTKEEDLKILHEEAANSMVKKKLANKPMTKYGKEAGLLFKVDFTFKLEQ